jgi:uncharacterized protein YkwD
LQKAEIFYLSLPLKEHTQPNSMKNTIQFLLILFMPLLSCSAQQNYTYSNQSRIDSSPPPISGTFSEQVLKEVNQLRAAGCKCGSKRMAPTHSLSWDNQLMDAAKRHALDIASRQQLDHTGKDGSDIMSRVSDTGYSWSNVAENIAMGYWDIPSVIQGWVDSPGHCRNMMNPDYKEVAVYREGEYWVMVLATKL